MKLGELIRKRRKELKLTQIELAFAVGIDFSYISKIENGGTKIPSMAILESIADVLELDIEEMKIAGEMFPQNVLDVMTSKPKVLELLSEIGEKDLNDEDINALIGLI